MIIRKKFSFEGAHIVRNCSSRWCRENIHGHSYDVEVFLKSDKLDRGYMVMDFILLSNVEELIRSFDHSYSLWSREKQSIKEAVYQITTRVVEIPTSPSAEGYALLFLLVVDKIIKNTRFSNGEGKVQLHSVRVHETQTGYAEAFTEDFGMIDFTLDDILFSESIQRDWESPWWKHLLENRPYENNLL